MHPLAARRHAAPLSQRELAKLAKVGRTAIQNIETGQTLHPQPGTIRALAEALGCEPADLME